ncbi:MAG: P-loop NTPase [Treponema sp.]|nr:P-loop NTPase [Treponema sp.]
MVHLLPIASGKGGVGKSALAVSLAISLAQNDKKVILVDLDLGGANLHTLLGLKNNHAGIGNFINRQINDVSALLQDTGTPNLKFIAGDCLLPGTANMDYLIKKSLIQKLSTLDGDYLIMDLGAGAAYNTLDFFLLTHNSLIVTTPEITSVLNAYSFLKSSAYRFLSSLFSATSAERKFIKKYTNEAAAGSETSFLDLLDDLYEEFPDCAEHVKKELELFRPQVILNNGNDSHDLEMCRRLRALSQKKLGMGLDFIGFIPHDDNVSLAVALRTPLVVSNPSCKFSLQVKAAAERIMLHNYNYSSESFDNNAEDADLEQLGHDFSEGHI